MTKDEARLIISSAVSSARNCGVDLNEVIEILQTLKVELYEHKQHIDLHLQIGEANDL